MKKKIVGIIAILAAIFLIGMASKALLSSPKSPEPSTSASIEALKSLPYLTCVSKENNAAESGVAQYDQARSSKGLNLYNPANLAEAYLLDISGKVLHTWSAKVNIYDIWYCVKLCENGDLLAIAANSDMLIRLDWNSNIKWVKKGRFHHDISLASNGDIYTLERIDEVIPEINSRNLIRNDYLVILNSNGELKKRISLANVLLNSGIPVSMDRPSKGEKSMLRKAWIKLRNYKKYHNLSLKSFMDLAGKAKKFSKTNRSIDVFHTNTANIIKSDVFYNSKLLFEKGNVLICMREMNLIGVVNVEKQKMVWHWGQGHLDGPHNPTLLEDGNILIFDNGLHRKYSRIIELDPSAEKIVWEYESDPPEQFFSFNRGSTQRLPNGNTLITESNSGYVFEITKEGDIVWEFFNPEKDENGKRTAIYRMIRIVDAENFAYLRALIPPPSHL